MLGEPVTVAGHAFDAPRANELIEMLDRTLSDEGHREMLECGKREKNYHELGVLTDVDGRKVHVRRSFSHVSLLEPDRSGLVGTAGSLYVIEQFRMRDQVEELRNALAVHSSV